MRALAIVALKVTGVVILFTTIILVSQLISLAISVYRTGQMGPGQPFMLVAFVLCLLFVWLLLGKTTWLVDRLGIPEQELQLGVSATQLLQVGLIVFGVVAIIGAISQCASTLYMASQMKDAMRWDWYAWGNLVAAGIKLCLAIIIVGKSRRIAASTFR